MRARAVARGIPPYGPAPRRINRTGSPALPGCPLCACGSGSRYLTRRGIPGRGAAARQMRLQFRVHAILPRHAGRHALDSAVRDPPRTRHLDSAVRKPERGATARRPFADNIAGRRHRSRGLLLSRVAPVRKPALRIPQSLPRSKQSAPSPTIRAREGARRNPPCSVRRADHTTAHQPSNRSHQRV
jgi:hypothetical protein